MATRGGESLQCEKCGSVFFQEAEFRQYYGGTYSSAPGGDLFVFPGPTYSGVRVCLCGHPMIVKSRMPAGFRESLAAALSRRAASEIEVLRANLLQEFGTKQQIAELKNQLAALEKIVAGETPPRPGTSRCSR